MKNCLLIATLLLFCCLNVSAAGGFQQTVTLFVPRDPTTGTYNEQRACINFSTAALSEATPNRCDLRYGSLQINNEDWFGVSAGNEKRSVIKDLGEKNWSDRFQIPALEPLPELKKGETRVIGIDASADTHKRWAATNGIHAKAIEGHMYLVHIKDEESDFYALVRVESLTQRNNCVISWSLIQSPEPTGTR